MKQTIVQFANTLRAAGVRISTSEVLDCMQGLETIDAYQRNEFYALLKATFVKSHAQFKIFDQCFHLFFELAQTQPMSSDASELPKNDTPAAQQLEQYEDFLSTQIEQTTLQENDSSGNASTEPKVKRW